MLKKGRAVHSREHIVTCSAVFGKAEAVQEYTSKEISKQKHLREVITIKRKRFRQVKTMNPFPLNRMFHIDYKMAEEGLIYNQLQNSRGRRVLHRLQSSPIYN